MHKIIMLSGKQGSGKSTLSNVLKALLSLEYPVEQIKFASVIYRMHNACQKVLKEYAPEFSKEKDGRLLQLLGTEWGRNSLDKNIWCKALQGNIKRYSESYPNMVFIIDDCRFENEFNSFQEALRVRLEAPAMVRKSRANSWRDDENHPSEIGLDRYANAGGFDLVLNTERLTVRQCADLILKIFEKDEWTKDRLLLPFDDTSYDSGPPLMTPPSSIGPGEVL